MLCRGCGDDDFEPEDLCPSCHACDWCCLCDDGFTDDELGIDPEEEYDA